MLTLRIDVAYKKKLAIMAEHVDRPVASWLRQIVDKEWKAHCEALQKAGKEIPEVD